MFSGIIYCMVIMGVRTNRWVKVTFEVRWSSSTDDATNHPPGFSGGSPIRAESYMVPYGTKHGHEYPWIYNHRFLCDYIFQGGNCPLPDWIAGEVLQASQTSARCLTPLLQALEQKWQPDFGWIFTLINPSLGKPLETFGERAVFEQHEIMMQSWHWEKALNLCSICFILNAER